MSVDGDDDVRCWLLAVMDVTSNGVSSDVVHAENDTLICGSPYNARTNIKSKRNEESHCSRPCLIETHTKTAEKRTHTHTEQRESKKNERNNEQAFQRDNVHFTLFYEVHKRHEVSFQRQWFCFFFAFLFFSIFFFRLTPIREERERKWLQRDRVDFCIFHMARDYIKDLATTTHRTMYQRNFQDSS